MSSPKFWRNRGAEKERGRKRGRGEEERREKKEEGRRGEGEAKEGERIKYSVVYVQPELKEIKLTDNLGSWSGSAFTLPII